MKIYTLPKPQRRGYTGVLSVIVIGGFMLSLMATTYRSAVRSLQNQKKVQLKIDYEAREQAWLRSVVTMAPVYAANSMMEGSASTGFKNNVSTISLFTNAGEWANVEKALPDAQASSFGFTSYRRGNTGDTTFTRPADYVGFWASDSTQGINGVTKNGVNATESGNYPPPLIQRGHSSSPLSARSSVDTAAATNSQTSLLISSSLSYATSGSPHAKLYADTNAYERFNLIPYPNIHFGYAKPGDNIVGRQNWWRLYMHMESKDANLTGVASESLDGREYILSIFEIPSQLAISSATFTNLGTIAGSDWGSKVSVEGNVYARKANAAGGSFSGLATTEGATLSGGATVGTIGAGSSTSRESFEAANPTEFYPISKASDYARSLFVPINEGIEFFDRFTTQNTSWSADPTGAGGNRLSHESWYQYSRGCNQCAMKLDVIAVVSASDQTPTALRFTYLAGGSEQSVVIYRAGSSYAASEGPSGIEWPEAADDTNEEFPFYTVTVNGRPGLELYTDRLVTWMENSLSTAPDGFNINHSICVNADYTQTHAYTPAKPSFPSSGSDVALVLRGCEDLTDFTKGFSIVTNFRLYIAEDLNQVEASTTPTGVSSPFYPPISIFTPEKRFGTKGTTNKIEYNGSLGSLKDRNSSSAANILDLKRGATDAVEASNLDINLKPIKHPAELPPVNMMNWLVVVQRVVN